MNREFRSTFHDDELPDGWKRVQQLASPLVTAIVGSYWRHINDSLGILGFINTIPTTELFISHDGWVMVAEGNRGFSAVLHAAKWNHHSDEESDHYEKIVEWIQQTGKFTVLNARMADHAEMAIKLARSIGFEETGLVPQFDTYQGEIHNLKLFSRFAK